MKRLFSAAALASALFLGGCSYTAPVIPPIGLFYANVSAPIDTNADNTPVSARSGESGTTSILGLFAFGDASVTTAARNGGLSTVNHVDYEYFHVLYVYQTFTVRAYGD